MPRKTSKASVSLEQAVREIGENLAKLTARLVGDEQLQTKGLIYEFTECRSSCRLHHEQQAKRNADTDEALKIMVVKLQAVEEFKQKQEAINKETEAFRDSVVATSNKFMGGWKAISILIAAVTPVSGTIGWLIAHYAK